MATHSNILCWKIPLIEERVLMNNTAFILTVPLIVVLKTHMPEYCSDKGTIRVILVPLDCETFAPCFISLHMFQCLLLFGNLNRICVLLLCEKNFFFFESASGLISILTLQGGVTVCPADGKVAP